MNRRHGSLMMPSLCRYHDVMVNCHDVMAEAQP